MAADSDSQVPIFLERIRTLFRPSPGELPRGEDPNRGKAITVCVLLSLILWLSLALQEARMVTVSFPVEVGGVEEGQALVERPPSSVRVQLQGTGLSLLRLVFDPPSVVVPAGTEQVDVEEVLNLPRTTNARIESITPRFINIETQPRVERTIPVRSRVGVELAPSYELVGDVTLFPDSIQISGGKSVVEPIRAWPTDSLVLEGVRDTVRREIPLQDSLAGLVERTADEVTLVARAGKFAVEDREVVVDVTGVPAGQDLVTLQPSTIRIRYRVLFDQLFEARRSSEFFATVSYSQIRSDTTGYVEPRIHVPSDLEIRDPEPIPPRLQYYTLLSGR